MFFEYPGLLWLEVLPVLLAGHYIYLELCGRRPHLRVSAVTPWKAGGKSILQYIRHLPFIFREAALALIILFVFVYYDNLSVRGILKQLVVLFDGFLVIRRHPEDRRTRDNMKTESFSEKIVCINRKIEI